jgi:hypothetical protein
LIYRNVGQPSPDDQRAEALEERMMLKLSLAVTVVTSVLAALATGAVAQKLPEAPLAVVCWNERTKIFVVGNLATIKEDGTSTYVGPSGRLSATVNAKGLVEPPSDRTAALDCYGKTLDQLRAMGRVIELKRTP